MRKADLVNQISEKTGIPITKKRAAKIGRNIKKNVAVHIPEHFIPAFKPAKEFVAEVKKLQSVKEDQPNPDEEM